MAFIKWTHIFVASILILFIWWILSQWIILYKQGLARDLSTMDSFTILVHDREYLKGMLINDSIFVIDPYQKALDSPLSSIIEDGVRLERNIGSDSISVLKSDSLIYRFHAREIEE